MPAPEEAVLTQNSPKPPDPRRAWIVTLILIVLAACCCGGLWFSIGQRSAKVGEGEVGGVGADKSDGGTEARSVEVNSSENKIQVVEIGQASPIPMITVAGTIEPNQQQMQEISSLAAGRVQDVSVSLGDHVMPGTMLLTIQSPQVAEMHGKLHEAETKLAQAKINLSRAKQSANRVAVLKARATLAEADSTLKRNKQLFSEGLSAGKDVVAAEADFERAQAEYNFQKDISLNREVSDATAALSTAETEAEHIRDSLKALDAQLPKGPEGGEHEISTLVLKSPIAGVVIDRAVNPGSGVEAGKPLITVADTSSLWVIANVPENDMQHVRLGMSARVLLAPKVLTGRVNFIDPRLNEDTRTSRVRIEIRNPNNQIQTGSFVQVELLSASDPSAIYVPATALQQIDGKNVVFVRDNAGAFVVRSVEAGDEVQGLVPIRSGLARGEKVAVQGAFIIKSKLLKGQLGEDD